MVVAVAHVEDIVRCQHACPWEQLHVPMAAPDMPGMAVRSTPAVPQHETPWRALHVVRSPNARIAAVIGAMRPCSLAAGPDRRAQVLLCGPALPSGRGHVLGRP